MKKTTLLLSALLMTAGMVATAGQTQAATDPATESKTSAITAELTQGTISLVKVPNLLDFGQTVVPIHATDMAQGTKGSVVEVSDSRGTGAGYKVDVALSKQFTSGTHELTGSTLTVKNAGGTSVDSGSSVADGKTKDVTLKGAGTTGEIITAAKDSGLGTWDYSIADSNLNVLPGMYAGAYTGELTWTLTAGPNA
ncbi:WxL domain-containing protein [Latilactobacillus sakei]|uniref:WxL domain-containing protein n=1 Tax=Latilactobacillus sakei TaxID=1599 RepID=UPI003F52D1DE